MTDPVPIHSPERQLLRHPELVSGSISPIAQVVQAEEWMLKRDQHDHPSILGKGRQTQSDGEIMPIGIFAEDQVYLPLAVPALELFLAQDGAFHVAEHFVPDEKIHAVSASEAFNFAATMLPEPCDEVAGDTDVERSVGFTGEDVDARSSLELHGLESETTWMLKQVQHDDVTENSSCD